MIAVPDNEAGDSISYPNGSLEIKLWEQIQTFPGRGQSLTFF